MRSAHDVARAGAASWRFPLWGRGGTLEMGVPPGRPAVDGRFEGRCLVRAGWPFRPASASWGTSCRAHDEPGRLPEFSEAGPGPHFLHTKRSVTVLSCSGFRSFQIRRIGLLQSMFYILLTYLRLQEAKRIVSCVAVLTYEGVRIFDRVSTCIRVVIYELRYSFSSVPLLPPTSPRNDRFCKCG